MGQQAHKHMVKVHQRVREREKLDSTACFLFFYFRPLHNDTTLYIIQRDESR